MEFQKEKVVKEKVETLYTVSGKNNTLLGKYIILGDIINDKQY